MSWLLRYSQTQQEGTGEVVDAPQGMQQQLFDGGAVNDVVQEKVIDPLNQIANESAASFLEALQQDSTRQLATLLAWNGRLDEFYAVVEQYDPNIVIDGTQIAKEALDNWFSKFDAAGGNRVPFDTLRTEIEYNANT